MTLPLAADYPSFLNVLWTTFMIFVFFAWIWVLISVLSDIFSRHDMNGWIKAIWVIAMIFIPFAGVLVYLIAYGKGMAERRAQQIADTQQAVDAHIKTVAGGSAAEIKHAKELLDSGAITEDEFAQLKAKALAA